MTSEQALIKKLYAVMVLAMSSRLEEVMIGALTMPVAIKHAEDYLIGCGVLPPRATPEAAAKSADALLQAIACNPANKASKPNG